MNDNNSEIKRERKKKKSGNSRPQNLPREERVSPDMSFFKVMNRLLSVIVWLIKKGNHVLLFPAGGALKIKNKKQRPMCFSSNEVDSKRVYSEGNRCFFFSFFFLFIYFLVCIYSSTPAGLAPASSSSPVVFCHVFSRTRLLYCGATTVKWV